MNVVTDKATWKHRARQFVMAITMVTDAPELLQTIYLGLPAVKRHCGMEIAESIKTLLDEHCLQQTKLSEPVRMGSTSILLLRSAYRACMENH